MAATDHIQEVPADVDLDEDHTWVMRVNDEGDAYEVCLSCGQQAHWEPRIGVMTPGPPERGLLSTPTSPTTHQGAQHE